MRRPEDNPDRDALKVRWTNLLRGVYHFDAKLLRWPPGRPSYRPLVRYQSFFYQTAGWKRARLVVAQVEFHLGELFPRVGFTVTNLKTSNRAVVRFHNGRGTAEQWIKEGKQAAAITRLSCHRLRTNQVRLWLSVLAYNLDNLWRRLGPRKVIANWSLTSLQQRPVKTGGRPDSACPVPLAAAGGESGSRGSCSPAC